MSRTIVLAISTLCITSLARSEDRFVNPVRPGAYPTLQAALDAANPGDRILVEVDLPWAGLTTVTKSVTIESADGFRKTLPYLGNATQPGTFLISGLNPPLPLVLRSLAFRFFRGPDAARDTVGIRTEGHYLGNMHMDDMSIDNGDQRVDRPVTLVDVDFNVLWIHSTRIVCKDSLPIPGLAPLQENTGSDCLIARVRQLVIEDSELWAGSAPLVQFVDGPGQDPTGGLGGRALVAPTDATVAVRTLFSDGNGGSVELGPWTVTPAPGPKGVTQWKGIGSMFQGWNSIHGPAFDGRLVSLEDPSRDVQVFADRPIAPLHISGNALVGGALLIDVNVTPADPCVVLVGVRWAFIPVGPQGILWIDPTKILMVFGFNIPAAVTLPLPNDPLLIGVPVIGQPVMLMTGELMNPSSMTIR
jgi:hypothetical protein